MLIKKISDSEVTFIYNNYIIDDFPDNERRPLKNIIYLINKGVYIPYALFLNNKIIGYAFFYGLDNQYICDYFGVAHNYKGQGYGSYLLQECLKLFSDKMIYFEVEKPEEPDLAIKQKRINFYVNNGLIINDIELYLYFVDYVILSNKKTDTTQVEQLYKRLYEPVFYSQYIQFKK